MRTTDYFWQDFAVQSMKAIALYSIAVELNCNVYSMKRNFGLLCSVG